MKISINNGCVGLTRGNGALRIAVGALPVFRVGSCRETFFALSSDGIVDGEAELRDGILSTVLYGEKPPDRSDLVRSAVRIEIALDEAEPIAAATVKAAHTLRLRVTGEMTVRDGLCFGRGAAGTRFAVGGSGCCRFFERQAILEIEPGESRFLVVSSPSVSTPDRLRESVGRFSEFLTVGRPVLPKAAGRPRPLPTAIGPAFAETVDWLRAELAGRQSREGGFLTREPEEALPTLREQLACFSFAAADRDRPTADRFLGLLSALWGRYGFLPDRFSADGREAGSSPGDPTDVLLALRGYLAAFGDFPGGKPPAFVGAFPGNLIKKLKGGRMPDAVDPDLAVWAESAGQTLRFLLAARTRLALGDDLVLASAVLSITARWRANAFEPLTGALPWAAAALGLGEEPTPVLPEALDTETLAAATVLSRSAALRAAYLPILAGRCALDRPMLLTARCEIAAACLRASRML